MQEDKQQFPGVKFSLQIPQEEKQPQGKCRCVCGHTASDIGAYLRHMDNCYMFNMDKPGIKTHRNKLGGLVIPLPPKTQGES